MSGIEGSQSGGDAGARRRPRIAIVGAQFGDPLVFAQWIHERFGVAWRRVDIGEHDRIQETVIAAVDGVRVEAAIPAFWAPEVVYDHIFREAPDAVLLVLTAMRDVAHVNDMALGWARPHLARLDIEPVVVVNDPHGRNPKFPTLSGERVRRAHGVEWSVHETMVGNFTWPLRWDEGAPETWEGVLARARRTSASSP